MTAPTPINSTKHKILLLDDDPDTLDLYQETLLQLSSQPEVQIATSGARAISLLEADAFSLLISDLRMPKMDGLQVIAVVRKRFPQLRTIVLTAAGDDQLRSRAYAMGIDLFLEKPGNKQELQFFLECVESLLSQDGSGGGFRGVQSKSLVDIIQLECLSGSSSVLRISNGKLDGKIWIQNGDVIDAATGDLGGEEAFRSILSWKTGNFEILPEDKERTRTIHASYQGLLLDTAQSLDEASAQIGSELISEERPGAAGEDGFGRIRGIEFALRIAANSAEITQQWGLDQGQPIADWARVALKDFEQLAERLQLGPVESLTLSGASRHVHVTPEAKGPVVGGFVGSLTQPQVAESMQKVLERWGS